MSFNEDEQAYQQIRDRILNKSKVSKEFVEKYTDLILAKVEYWEARENIEKILFKMLKEAGGGEVIIEVRNESEKNLYFSLCKSILGGLYLHIDTKKTEHIPNLLKTKSYKNIDTSNPDNFGLL